MTITPLDIAAFVTRNIMGAHKDDIKTAADAYRANTPARITQTVADAPRGCSKQDATEDNPFE
jgi:hypothetical protein